MTFYGAATVRLYRDRRYANVWLVGAGQTLHLSGALFATYEEWFLLVEDEHDQMLKMLLHQCGLEWSDLVPATGW